MNAQSDHELLRAYAALHDEAAFRELVQRHTDLVYSAARRQVESDTAARDLTQRVFTDLARRSSDILLKQTGQSLVGWLHRATRYAALNHRRDARRRLANEKLAMEQLVTDSDTPADWELIHPTLDEALDSLADSDRNAVLLRYFQNHDLRTIGAMLGVSDDAAQKRVSRAVERLREFYAERGVPVGAGGLALALSANAAQAAPAGMALAISSVATLAETTLATTATGTAATAIVMTALKKTLVTVVLVAAFTAPLVLKHREASRLQKEVEALRWEKEALLTRIKRESAEASPAIDQALAPEAEVSAPADPLPAEVVARIAAMLSDRRPMTTARRETWAKLMAQISSDQLDDALQAARQVPDHEIRTAITEALFRSWIETNPRAALAFATVSFQGQEKSNAIRDAIEHWAAHDPDGAFAAWREQSAGDSAKRLSWGGDQQEITRALFAGMAQQDFQKAVHYLNGVERELFGGALAGLGTTAAKTEQGRAFFLDQLTQVNDQPVSYEAISGFMHGWAQNDFPSAKAWVEGQPPGNQRDYALRQVGLNYVRRDPKAGADWWLAQATPAERAQAFFGIAQGWASIDIKAAGEWLNRQGSGAALDSGRSAFADVAVEHDPETALMWAESISEPTYRNEVLARTLRKWQRLDSAAAEQFLIKSGWPPELMPVAK